MILKLGSGNWMKKRMLISRITRNIRPNSSRNTFSGAQTMQKSAKN